VTAAATTPATASASVIRLRARTAAVLAAVSAVGVIAFAWPLFVHHAGAESSAHSADAPWLFVVVLPLLLGVVLAELAAGAIDSKAIAMLGVLTACGAALRIPGTGVTGFTPVFFLLLPAGRVFGRGFGFVLGALTMFVSALLTAGVGPWLPFQMFGAGWVGFFAGCLPPARGRRELYLLAAYGAVAGLVFGLLLDLWFWPFATQGNPNLTFVPGASLVENLQRFWAYHLATSLGFDIPRAIGNAALVLLAGHPVLAALRRAQRKAVFDASPAFVDAD
jgi:energy-coupling factor transport system substrate-specific component